MFLNINKQTLPIFNPITEQFLSYQPRHIVHTKGYWHRAVQANIVRINKNHESFDILVQQRSDIVDIAQLKYDQSLATQMIKEDNFDLKKTLQRGLLSELGIKQYRHKEFEATTRIVKTYRENKYFNRELLTLFIVKIDESQVVSPTSKKVKNIQWLSWKNFLTFYQLNQHNFTKTAQFYFSNKAMLNQIKKLTDQIVGLSKNPTTNISRYKSFLHIDKNRKKKLTYQYNQKNLYKYINLIVQ